MTKEEVKKPVYVSNPKRVESGWHYVMICEYCGAEFHAKRKTAKFCSDTCRVMHFYGKGKKITKQENKTTLFASSRNELVDFLKKMGYHLNETPIKRGYPKEIIFKGQKWIIKRMSYMTYAIEQI